jgi:hypothetical protein
MISAMSAFGTKRTYLRSEDHRTLWQKTVVITPVSADAWAACRAARTPSGGVTPPTPRWSAQENSGRRSCRFNGDESRKTFALPVDSGAACRTEMKGQRVATFGYPHPRRSLTREGDLLPAEACLVADHRPSAALALQTVAHGNARWFALN